MTAPIGTIATGIIIDKFGRKSALIFSLLPSIAGWLLLLWDYSDFTTLLGQGLNGLTVGAVGYSSQVYAGECIMVNHVRLRSSYLMWTGLNISVASLFMYAIAIILNFRQICAVVAAISVVILSSLYIFIPESPVWLYRQGRYKEAERSQQKLRIKQPILKTMKGESQPLLHKEEGSLWTHFRQVLAKLSRPDVWKPLIIFSTFGALYSFCGTYGVITYTIPILEGSIYGRNSISQTAKNESLVSTLSDAATLSVSDDSTSAYFYNLVSGVLMVASAISASFGIPYLGLKKTMVISLLGTFVAMVMLANTVVAAEGFLFGLRVVAIWIMAFFFGPASKTPYSAAGDALPADAKGFTSIPMLFGSLSSAFVRKIFPYLCVALGAYTYWIFSVMCVLCAIHAYFCLTEVVGKTLDEINRGYLAGTE